MSSEQTVPAASAIPDARQVEATGLGGAWRFADGKIRRGRKGSFEDYPPGKVVGYLRRVGIHSGKTTGDSPVPYSQVEADIETANGLEHFKSSLTDDNGIIRSSSASNGFVWGLLQIGKDEEVMITCELADFETEKGGKPTFVNVWKHKGDWKFDQLVRPKRDKNAPKQSQAEQWLSMESAWKSHPAYADRPARDDDGSGPITHLAELCQECASKGWPTPEQMPSVWLARLAEANGHAVKARLSDYEDDAWGAVRLALKGVTQVPEFLRPHMKAPEPAQGSIAI